MNCVASIGDTVYAVYAKAPANATRLSAIFPSVAHQLFCLVEVGLTQSEEAKCCPGL